MSGRQDFLSNALDTYRRTNRRGVRAGSVRGYTVIVHVLTLVGALPLAVCAQQIAASTAASAAAVVFEDVTVVDMEDGKLIPHQRVVITGNRIAAVGAARTVILPPGARLVDARGRYLIPGLWDMHVHLISKTMDETARDEQLYLTAGVTGIRTAGDRPPLDTLRQWRREVLAGTRAGPPRQVLSGMAINDDPVGGVCQRRKTHMACVTDTADARHLVDSLAAAGADMIKPRGLSRTLYRAVAAAARRHGLPFGGHAYGGNTPAEDWYALFSMNHSNHFDDGITPREASELGARIIDHRWGEQNCEARPVHKWDRWLGTSGAGLLADEQWVEEWLSGGGRPILERLRAAAYTPERFAYCVESAREFRRHGTWFVPTLGAAVPWAFLGASDSVSARFARRLEVFKVAGGRLRGNWLRDSAQTTRAEDGILRLAERTGLPLLAGTDVLGGGFEAAFAIHAELARMVAEGLSPLHALQAATLNPALMLHGTDSLGTVAAGKLADLVLLDENPLVDITNTTTIHAVVANGRYFDRAALDQMLR